MKRFLNIVLFVALALSASAATWYVRPNESIRAGIDNCRAGDTLLIEAGTYREAIVLKDGIAIIGQGEVILDGTNLASRLISCDQDCQQPTLIENLILQNARHNQRGGAAWLRGKVTMRHCVIRGCSGVQCGGDECYDLFLSELTEHVADDDAILIIEGGHEKLACVVGSVTVITKDGVKGIDIKDAGINLAREMLQNDKWQTDCCY